MNYTYYCKYCNSDNVWVEGMRHLNHADTFTEYERFYCGECENEIKSVGIRGGNKDLLSCAHD